MTFQVLNGQVAISDPNPGGPSALSNVHQEQNKIVRLTSANFSTAGVNTLVAKLPPDSTITSMALWVKTQLSGGSISAATISVGLTSAGTDFISAISAFAASSVRVTLTPISGIYELYNIPWGNDILIWVNGTSTTGTPTAGEMYLQINYTR